MRSLTCASAVASGAVMKEEKTALSAALLSLSL